MVGLVFVPVENRASEQLVKKSEKGARVDFCPLSIPYRWICFRFGFGRRATEDVRDFNRTMSYNVFVAVTDTVSPVSLCGHSRRRKRTYVQAAGDFPPDEKAKYKKKYIYIYKLKYANKQATKKK